MNSADLIRFPQTILNSCARERVEERLHRAILDRRERGEPAFLFMKRLAWHPALAARLMRAGVLTPSEIEILMAEPAAACSILLEDYAALAPRLESHLLSDPPSIERILVDLRVTGRAGLRPEAEYLELLSGDPDRRYRLTPVSLRPIWLERLRTESEMRWGESAAQGYFYFATHANASLSRDLAAALTQDEEYQFLALRLALARGRAAAECVRLGSFQTPAWAFHALRECRAAVDAPACLNVLHAHPAWIAEWWQSSRCDRTTLESSYLEAAERCALHELVPELYWFYRTVHARAAVAEFSAPSPAASLSSTAAQKPASSPAA